MPQGLILLDTDIDLQDRTVRNLQEVVELVERDVRRAIQVNVLREARIQENLGNPASGFRIDKVDIRDRSSNSNLTVAQLRRAVTGVNYRARVFYQFNKDVLKRAVMEAWVKVEQRTKKAASPGGETMKTFYFKGRTSDIQTLKPTYTPRMKSISEVMGWIDRTNNPYMGVSIEGSQTPYRRKFLYVYAYKGRRIITERLRQRGFDTTTDQPIFSERAEFRVGRFKVRPSRRRNRRDTFEVQANKAYMRTIAQGLKRRYVQLGIGYGFVPADPQNLKSYASSTGKRPWGKYLPRIFIGLNPGRRR